MRAWAGAEVALALVEVGAGVVFPGEADVQGMVVRRRLGVPLAQVIFSWESTKVWRLRRSSTGEA